MARIKLSDLNDDPRLISDLEASDLQRLIEAYEQDSSAVGGAVGQQLMDRSRQLISDATKAETEEVEATNGD